MYYLQALERRNELGELVLAHGGLLHSCPSQIEAWLHMGLPHVRPSLPVRKAAPCATLAVTTAAGMFLHRQEQLTDTKALIAQLPISVAYTLLSCRRLKAQRTPSNSAVSSLSVSARPTPLALPPVLLWPW